MQNLARSRALEFGKVDLTDGNHGRPHHEEDLVVSTTATESEVASSFDVTDSSGPAIKIAGALSSLVDSALHNKPRGFFADQFENQSNYWAHYNGTGPEILRQTGGNVDAFVSGAGESLR